MLWRMLGGSVPGSLHIERDRGCDDAHGWSVEDELTVLVVADGAGSRPGTSAIGAHVAVASVLERVAKQPEVPIAALFEHARDALTAEAEDLGVKPDCLATTLCIALLAPERTIVGQVGDGVAVIEKEGGAVQAVAIAERFEYANEVVFLTTAGGLDHLKVFETDEPVHAVALSTDGLRYKILDDLHAGTPFGPFFEESWGYARRSDASSGAIERFLADVEDQTGDDKTLVLAVGDFTGQPGTLQALTARPPASGPVEENALGR